MPPSDFGNADREQALGVHVAKILDRKRRVAIVLGGARRQHAAAEAARLGDQVGRRRVEPERIGRQHRGVEIMRVDGAVRHRMSLAQARAGVSAPCRKSRTAASNARGASRLGKWPTPARQT